VSKVSALELEQQIAAGTLAGHWTLEPAQSSVSVKTKGLWGLQTIAGTFAGVSGEGVLAADGSATGTITITAASIDTKNAKRDTHLKSADFFDVDQHPNIVVTVTSVRPAGDKVSVEGALHAVGKTLPLSFPATVDLAGSTAVLDGTVAVDRSQLGMTWNQLGMASTKNDITVHLVFTRD
jgi:polyisoprenoid-binding protein YceI